MPVLDFNKVKVVDYESACISTAEELDMSVEEVEAVVESWADHYDKIVDGEE